MHWPAYQTVKSGEDREGNLALPFPRKVSQWTCEAGILSPRVSILRSPSAGRAGRASTSPSPNLPQTAPAYMTSNIRAAHPATSVTSDRRIEIQRHDLAVS